MSSVFMKIYVTLTSINEKYSIMTQKLKKAGSNPADSEA